MSRARVVVAARVGVAVAAVLFLLAAPSQAALITLNFSGSVNLSSVDGGQSNPHTYSGSITWDTTKIPFEPGTDIATYDLQSYTLFFDGVDYTAPVIGDGTGSGIAVANNFDAPELGLFATNDGLAFFLQFQQPFNIGGQPGSLVLLGLMIGPGDMFSSTALPTNLSFLTQLTGAGTRWLFEPDAEGQDEFLLAPIGSLILSVPPTGPPINPGPLPVPEPATLTLTALGMAGVLVRARRSRKIS